MNGSLVITGGGGFIGSRLVARLIGDGQQPVVIDARPGPALREWASQGAVRLIESDLADDGDLGPAVADAEVLVHLAALMDDTDDVAARGARSVAVNLLALMRLLTQARRLRHVVFTSTIMVYADPPRYAPIDEAHPTVPPNVYGATKLAAEHYLDVYRRHTGMAVTILRLCGAFGPGIQAEAMRHRAIPRFIDAVGSGRRPSVYGDGSERRDYVHVDDVVGALRAAIDRRRSGVFNVGSGRAVSVLELARTVAEVMGVDVEPMLVPERPAGGDYSVDISRARAELGYEPGHGLREGLADEVTWSRRMATRA